MNTRYNDPIINRRFATTYACFNKDYPTRVVTINNISRCIVRYMRQNINRVLRMINKIKNIHRIVCDPSRSKVLTN